jgi:hypothetical protein
MGILVIPFTGPTGPMAELDSGEPIPIAAGLSLNELRSEPMLNA